MSSVGKVTSMVCHYEHVSTFLLKIGGAFFLHVRNTELPSTMLLLRQEHMSGPAGTLAMVTVTGQPRRGAGEWQVLLLAAIYGVQVVASTELHGRTSGMLCTM